MKHITFIKYIIKIYKKIKYIISYKITPGIISDIDNNSIVNFTFNFEDIENTHTGDILFLLPIILVLQKNYNLSIKSNQQTIKLLEKFGYINNNIIDNNNIEISYIWNNNLRNKNYIYLNLTDKKITKKPSNVLYDYLIDLGYSINKIKNIQYNEEKKIIYDHKYFIYNNECESGLFRLFNARKKLQKKANELIRDGIIPICVGNQNNDLNFIECSYYIDLRGKTNLVDLADLLNNSNSIILTYDNAIAHLATILNKKEVFISMRWFTKKHSKYLKKYIFPLYESKTKIIYI